MKSFLTFGIIIFLLKQISTEPPSNYYLSDLEDPTNFTLSICPTNLSSRAGSIYLNREGSVYNVAPGNATITINLVVAANESCRSANDSFGFYLSFRSFHLENLNSTLPAFFVNIKSHSKPHSVSPNLTLLDYQSQYFQFYPRSEVQFSSGLKQNADLELDLQLRKERYDGSRQPIVIDFVLISDPNDKSEQMEKCDILNATIPKAIYCLDSQLAFLTCQEDCLKVNPLYNTTASSFDEDGFSYGSCGVDRSPLKCGESKELDLRSRNSFKLSTNTIIGICAAGAIAFIIGPSAVFCFLWYRRNL